MKIALLFLYKSQIPLTYINGIYPHRFRPLFCDNIVLLNHSIKKEMMETKSNKTVAIIGADSGVDKDITMESAAKRYQVFSTAFANAEIDEFQKSPGTTDIGLTITDITKEEDVAKGKCCGLMEHIT
jgi:hypothetical protein